MSFEIKAPWKERQHGATSRKGSPSMTSRQLGARDKNATSITSWLIMMLNGIHGVALKLLVFMVVYCYALFSVGQLRYVWGNRATRQKRYSQELIKKNAVKLNSVKFISRNTVKVLNC